MRITRVLVKTIALQFYKDHIGFFFAVLFFSGAFLRANEHTLIAEIAVSSLPILVLILSLWTIYCIRVVFYCKSQLHKRQNQFIKSISLLTYGKQFTDWAIVHIIITMPIIIYGGFIGKIAIANHEYKSLYLLALFLILEIAISSIMAIRFGNMNSPEKQGSKLSHWFDIRVVKPYPIWFIHYLLKKQPLTFLLSKGYSLLILTAFIVFQNSGDYDWRVISVGVVFSLIGGITIAQAHHLYEKEQLSLFKNLPLLPLERIRNWFITFSIILAPEIIVLLRYFPAGLGWDKLVGLMFLLLLFPLTVLTYQHMDNLDKDELMKAGLSVTLLFFFQILFSVAPLIIALGCLVLSLSIIRKYYHYISG